MHMDELQERLIGKKVNSIKFIYGMSGHCNFIDEIIFTDGTILKLEVVPCSDFIACEIAKNCGSNFGSIIKELRVFGKVE